MKVLTKSPVYINKKRVSDADLYMNFDANGKPTTKNEWKMFQSWHNKKGYTPALTEDGVTGTNTNNAWNKYGSEFVQVAKALTNVVTTATSGQSVVTPPEPTSAQKEEAAKKGLQWDKVKGWVKVGKESGFFDAVLNKLGVTTPTYSTTTTTDGSVNPLVTKTQAQIDEEEKKKKRRTLIIIGSIALVAVIGVVLLIRKKSEPAK